MFIPVVLTIANKTGLNRKRLLMPLSIAALTSGMMTLIASSPNMIIDNTLRARGLAPFGFFSWTPFGLAVLATGILFMLAGRRYLSEQLAGVDAAATTAPRAYELVGSYGLADRLHRLRVPVGSPLIDRAVVQIQPLYDRLGVFLLGFEKNRRGATQFLPALPETVCEANDSVFVVAGNDQVQQLIETQNLVELPKLDERQRSEALQEVGAAEIMLTPESTLIGKSLTELDFRSRYRVTVLAVRHRGEPLTTDFVGRPLDFGDTLLVAGGWANIQRLGKNDRESFVLLTLPAEYDELRPARRRAPIAVAIVVAMAVIMAFQLVPNSATALLAALTMVASGCVALDDVYRIISWKTLVLIAGMLVPLTKMKEAAEIAKSVADKAKPGDPRSADTTMGPVVNRVQWEKIQGLIKKGIDEGATLVAGGLGRPDGLNKGYYVRPTVFADVSNEMTIAREEIFGPVLSIIGYKNEDDAVSAPRLQ